jgi:hypothetical protein
VPVLVDLRQLTFIDGAGLGALVSARARARIAGQTVTLIRRERQFDALLRVTGLEDLFETVDPGVAELRPSGTDREFCLECPRCGLTTVPDDGDPAHERHCPRCLGTRHLAIPMSRVPSR